MAVTCRKALENEAVLEKPNSTEMRAMAFLLASQSIACTIRARCRQDLKVIQRRQKGGNLCSCPLIRKGSALALPRGPGLA